MYQKSVNKNIKPSKKFHAVFDGKVLKLEEPVNLIPNTRVELTIKLVKPEAPKSVSFLKTACSIGLEGPKDWSARFEEYLYGSTKDVGK